MSDRHSRAPYAWAAAGVVAVVAAAWFNQSRVVPAIPGNPAPSFEVMAPGGEAVRLEDYSGKVVLLNVWATWCGPCREEMPSMQRLYQQFSPEDFEILAVSVDALPGQRDLRGYLAGDPVAFADSLGLTFPILLNPSGEIERIFQTSGVPESFLIGRDGMIYKRVAGSTAWDAEANRIQVKRLVEDR